MFYMDDKFIHTVIPFSTGRQAGLVPPWGACGGKTQVRAMGAFAILRGTRDVAGGFKDRNA